MKIDEMGKFLTKMALGYPHFSLSKENIFAYADWFKDIDLITFEKAFKMATIDTDFFPNVAQISKQVRQIAYDQVALSEIKRSSKTQIDYTPPARARLTKDEGWLLDLVKQKIKENNK